MIVDSGAQCAGSLSVNDPHGRYMCNVSIIQIFVKPRDRLVGIQPDQIDLRRDGSGFAHLELASGTAAILFRWGECILIDDDEILDVDE